jgi:N,N'-diacetyllegionaminate synthase
MNNKKVYIIAEAGVNHNGKIEIAKKLIEKAKDSGADAVKFQTFKAEKGISRHAEKAAYQKNNTSLDETQLDMVKKLELSFEQFRILKKYCDEIGIMFMSTPFDHDSIDFLDELGMEIWKIPSGEITNLPYLIKVAKLKKPIILSTGMCTIDDISNAINVLKDNGASVISILHCTTEYPTVYSDVNLKAMLTIKDKFNIDIGYSDHTKGIEVSIAASALGATIIEKHFTLDNSMEGPDHRASLEPNELKQLVYSIRNIELALGSGMKEPAESEIKNINIARKSIIANKRIKKGEVFTEENLTVKRPGNGVSPMMWFEVLGRIALRDFEEDELIEL